MYSGNIKRPTEKIKKIGDIGLISRKKETWIGDYYYNSPEIIICDINKDVAVVRQMCMFNIMASQGDLILPNRDINVFNNLEIEPFIECWNTYKIPVSWFGTKFASIKDINKVMEDIKSVEADGSYVPKKGMISTPIQSEFDPRVEFRRIEQKIANSFATRAAEEIAKM